MAKNMKRIHKVTIKRMPDTAQPLVPDLCDTEYVYVRAEAQVFLTPDDKGWGLFQEITSGGLGGIDLPTCDCADRSWYGEHHDTQCPITTDEYLAEVEQEQLSELAEQLHAIGFSKRAIASAFKNVLREGN